MMSQYLPYRNDKQKNNQTVVNMVLRLMELQN